MSCWALIPFKGFDRGKSRLSSVLPPSEREELARKLAELEAKYDERFRVVFEAIRQLMEDPGGAHGRCRQAREPLLDPP